MSFNDDLLAELPALQEAAESRMTSRCTIKRRAARGSQNENTGRVTAGWTTTHTDLPCRVGGSSRGASATRTEEAGGVQRTISLRTLHMPIATTDLRDGDVAEVTLGACAGLLYQLIDTDPADQQTARRVSVEQVDRPSGWG